MRLHAFYIQDEVAKNVKSFFTFMHNFFAFRRLERVFPLNVTDIFQISAFFGKKFSSLDVKVFLQFFKKLKNGQKD